MKVGKKVIGIIAAVIVIVVGVGIYIILDSNKIYTVTLTISIDKHEYALGENVTIIVKESSVPVNFQISATAKYPNGVPAVGIELWWIPPSVSPNKFTPEGIKKGMIPSHYRGFVPFVINNRHLTYKFVWNQTIVKINALGKQDPLEFRAPAGYYLITLGTYQTDEGFGRVIIKTVYKDPIIFLHGLNFTLDENNSTLSIHSTDNMNFKGDVVFWKLTDGWNNTYKYFTSIPFTYSGKSLTINFENYSNITSVKRYYEIYVDTPYGKYWVGEYESPGRVELNNHSAFINLYFPYPTSTL